MNNPKDKITTTQASIAIASTLVGMGIITIPRTVGVVVNTPDVWISVLLGGLISFLFGYIVVTLSKKFPDKTFFQYSYDITGRYLGFIFNIIVIVYFILFSSFEVRILGEITKSYLLDKTPIELIMIFFLSVGVYLVVGGINPIVRICQVYFPIICLLFFSVMFISLEHFEINNIRPVLGKGILPVIRGVKVTALIYTGFEIIFILLPFMKNSDKALKATMIGISIPLLFYLTSSIIGIGVLTIEESINVTYPLMAIVSEFEFPGGFIERFEVFFSIIWVLALYTSFVVSYYCASFGLSKTFKKDINFFIYALLPIIYIIGIFPENLDIVFKLGDLFADFGLFVAGLMPILLLLIIYIKGVVYEKK
ncbi:MAG: spore gernimation protein [Firmicutes bacterium]|nr:spore gernimation protein [Bacillota bacterium]